jgi:hypothetical protein
MPTVSKDELFSVLSEYMDDIRQDEILKITSEHQAEIAKITSEHQAEIAKITRFHQDKTTEMSDEIHKLKTKLTALAQVEDSCKFQKRTIASLTAEISSMQSNVTSLEKRLKLASDELKSRSRTRDVPASLMPERAASDKPEQSSSMENQPEEQVAPVSPVVPEQSHTENQPEQAAPEEEDQELIPVVLQSGSYFWDPESNDLYEFISSEEAGEIVGLIKSVKIKNQIYLLDTSDNNFYDCLKMSENGGIGAHMGQVVDKKAIFVRKDNK